MFELNRLSLNDKNEIGGIEFCGHYVNYHKAVEFANNYIKRFPELRTFIEIRGTDGTVAQVRGDRLKEEML